MRGLSKNVVRKGQWQAIWLQMNWLLPMWSRLGQMRALCTNITYKHNYQMMKTVWKTGH
jgi:hypothetical protein